MLRDLWGTITSWEGALIAGLAALSGYFGYRTAVARLRSDTLKAMGDFRQDIMKELETTRTNHQECERRFTEASLEITALRKRIVHLEAKLREILSPTSRIRY